MRPTQRFVRPVAVPVLLAGVLAASANAAVDFAPRQAVPTAGATSWIAGSDLTGDGLLDLAVTNDSNTVAIHRGLGGGAFSGAATLPVGANPFAVALGDVNADGKLDILTANSDAASVSILLGDGAGGATSNSSVAVGTGPGTLTLGDITGDGKLDAVAMNRNLRTASLLTGAGDGTFTHTAFQVGDFATDTAIADLTGDAIGDLAVAGDGIRLFRGPLPTSVLPTTLPQPFGSFRVIAADLNADGILDLATANLFSYDMSVILGRGGGAFAPTVTRAASAGPSAVAAGDLNADGIVDIAVTNLGSGDVSVFEGAGGGGFRPAKQFRVGIAPQGVVIGDVNGDGRGDLVVADGEPTLSVLLSRPLPAGTTGTAKVKVRCLTPRRVTPGQFLSCLYPTMSRAQVREILGPPTRISRVAGSRDYIHRYSGMTVRFDGFENAAYVIRTTRPGVGTTNGIRVGGPGSLVKARFPRARCTRAGGVQNCVVPRPRTPIVTRFVITGQTVTAIELAIVPTPTTALSRHGR